MLIDEAARAYEEAEQKNIRYQNACRDLLREVMSHPELEAGFEFSIRYDENMNFVNGEEYRQGEEGSVKIADLGVPFHAFHNHGSDETLSLTDMIQFTIATNMLSLTAVGNEGSIYTIIKSPNSDSNGFMNFLISQLNVPFYMANGIEVNVLTMSSKKARNELSQKLSKSQIKDLYSQLAAFCRECAERGEYYGFEYKYKKT